MTLSRNTAVAGPPALPVVGHAFSFLNDKLGFLSRAAEMYGEVVKLQLGGPTYLLSNPADIRHVLISNSDNYEKTPRIIGARARRFFGSGVATMTRATHLRQRRLLHPAYHHEVMEYFGSCIHDGVADMFKRWPTDGVVDINREMLDLTQRIITRVLFGAESPDENLKFERAIAVRRQYQEYLLKSVSPISQYWPNKRNRRHARAERELTSITLRALEQRRESRPVDMLGMLAHARYEDESPMTDEQIFDEVRTIAVGGYETLAEALTWAWYLLAQDSAALIRVLAEADSFAADSKRAAADWGDLVYTRMVLAESMRLYPPAWLMVRVADNADVLPSGARIPARSRIYISQWVSHRNAEYFPEPERFDPSRFDAESMRARPRFSYFPFGGGKRQCIGEELAWMEGLLIIASIARRYELTLQPGVVVRPDPNVTLRPKGGLEMRVALRQ